MKHKHIRLFSFLIASVSLLALSACETSARYSEHFDWEGTLTQENKTEDSVTIQFKLTYGSAVELPSYATLWVEGSWLGDTDEGWNSTLQPLYYSSSTQSYNLVLTDVEHGEYKYQLVLGYTHLNEPNWDYQLTDKDNAPTFTINSEVTEVIISLNSSIEDFMPAYTETLTNYTLEFTFTYSGQNESIPDYADAYVIGSWDNSDSWTTFHKLELKGGTTDTYYYTIQSINVSETWYKYDIVLVYKDEEASYGHNISTGTEEDNLRYFEVTGFEGDGYTKAINLVLNESLSETIPEITSLSNYTLKFEIKYSGAAINLPTGASVYYRGGLESGGGWGDYTELTSEGNGIFSIHFDTIDVGDYKFELIVGASSSTSITWSEDHVIVEDATFSVSYTQGDNYTSESPIEIISSIDVSSILISLTYVITVTHNSTSLGALPSGMELYAAGDFFTYEGYETWIPVALASNSDGTFSLTLDFVPVVGTLFNLYIHDTTTGDSTDDMWNHIVGTYTFTTSDVSSTSGVISVNVEVITAYPSWNDVTADFVSYTVTVRLLNSDGSLFETAYDNYKVYMQSDYDNWAHDSGNEYGHLMTNNNDGTYSYKFESRGVNHDTNPSYKYTYNFYAGNENGNDWNHQLGTEYLEVSGNEGGNYAPDPIDLTVDYENWESIFKEVTLTNFTVNFYFVNSETTKNTYYSIPDYADAYLAGYITGDYVEGNDPGWDQPDYSTGKYKLIANGSSTSEGYSITFDTILSGERECCIYFDFNSNSNHGASSSFSWPTTNTGNFKMTIPTTGTSLDVYIEQDPSTIITDISGTSTTDFYVVVLNQTWSYPYSSMTVSSGNTTEGSYNLSTLNFSVTDDWSYSQTYYTFYNSTAASATAGASRTVSFSSSSGGGNSSTDLTISNLDIPETDSGTIAVYMVMFDSSTSPSAYWTNFYFTSNNTDYHAGWITGLSSITDFISNISTCGNIHWDS